MKFGWLGLLIGLAVCGLIGLLDPFGLMKDQRVLLVEVAFFGTIGTLIGKFGASSQKGDRRKKTDYDQKALVMFFGAIGCASIGTLGLAAGSATLTIVMATTAMPFLGIGVALMRSGRR